MNSTASRRAFSLDSRTVWVEQHHNGLGMVRMASPERKIRGLNPDTSISDATFIVSKEDSVLGPGDYSPMKPERHVYTTKLGPQSVFNDVKAFAFGSHMMGDSNKAARSTYSIVGDIDGSKQLAERSDMVTIFQEHDRRQPIDPRNRTCATPGALLTHSSLMESMAVDGKRKAKTVHLGRSDIPYGERNETKVALPSYNVKWDSIQLRPRPQLGVILKKSRFPHYDNPHKGTDEDVARPKSSQELGDARRQNGIGAPILSPIERPRSIAKPTITKRIQPEIKFDTSCYTDSKKSLHIDISPGEINKIVQSNMFGGILTVPKLHVSKRLESRIANRMEKYL